MIMKALIKQLLRENLGIGLTENAKTDPASLAALEKEGKKFFPMIKIVPADEPNPAKPQFVVELPEEGRTVSIGGFENHIAAAKIIKIEDWLKQKQIKYKKSNTTNSIYINGKKDIVRISDHRKGAFDGPDILVRWSTSLLEIMNAIYDFIKIN
jgi:hypothetical protein